MILGLFEIHGAEVLDGQHAVVVDVELLERVLDGPQPYLIQTGLERVHKLVVADQAVLVHVELVEQAPEFVLGDVDEAQVAQAVAELDVVDASRVVLVHRLEQVAHERAPVRLLRLEQKRPYQIYAHNSTLELKINTSPFFFFIK